MGLLVMGYVGASIQATDAPQFVELASIAVLSLNSPASRRNYSRELRRFMASGRPLTREGVQGWLVYLRGQGAGAVTRNIALAAIRLLAREAGERGLLDDRALASLERIKGSPVRGKKIGRWLELEEVRALMREASLGVSGTRNAALVALMVGCGLRRAEVCSLEWSDILERGGRLVVQVRGKGERMRVVPVPSWVRAYVEEWQMRKDEDAADKSEVQS